MPETFVDKEMATELKTKSESMIQEALMTMNFERKKRIFNFKRI